MKIPDTVLREAWITLKRQEGWTELYFREAWPRYVEHMRAAAEVILKWKRQMKKGKPKRK